MSDFQPRTVREREPLPCLQETALADGAGGNQPTCGLLIVTPWRADAMGGLVRASASKSYEYRAGAGWRKLSDYDSHHQIGILPVEVANLDDLADVVRAALECDAYIVRAALTPEAIAAQTREGTGPAGAILNRRKVPNRPGDKPSLKEADRRWVMLDVDGWPVPEHLSLHDVGDHEAIIDGMIRDVLHAEFHEVRCFYQFSASCGLIDSNTAKAHLWFWLNESASNDRLRALCIQQMPGVDYAPFAAGQPHYISPPKLLGGHDPMPSRMGWRDAEDQAVTLPAAISAYTASSSVPSGPLSNDWTAPLRLMGDGEGRLRCYGAIRGAIWRYVTLISRGGTRDDDMVIGLIAKAVTHAPRSESRSAADLKCYADAAWLRRQIESALRKQATQRGGLR